MNLIIIEIKAIFLIKISVHSKLIKEILFTKYHIMIHKNQKIYTPL